MSVLPYVNRTRQILTGYGLGEKPTIVRVAADAGNTVTGNLIDITLNTGEVNAKNLAEGDVLGSYLGTSGGTEASAWVGYVLAVNGTTDVVTCVNGYEGSTAISNGAGSNDGGFLYLHGDGSPTDFAIVNAVNTVFNTLLWPDIFKVEFDTEASPSMSTMRVDLDDTVEEIEEAWQIVGPDRIPIPFAVERVAPSEATPSSSGVVGTFDLFNSSTLYLKTIRRMVTGDSSTYDSLVEVVSTGAAAIAAGWSRPETTLSISKQDSRERGNAPDVGAALWRDFFAMRQAWADDLARTRADEVIVYRG